MHGSSLTAIADRYFKRFGYRPPMISQSPPQGMQLCVVIPCYDEPQVTMVLQALCDCEAPQHPLEVILVINAGIHEQEVQERNRESLETARSWNQKNNTSWLNLHFIWVDDLPAKHAGVGLARKIGMDEALHRFAFLDTTGMIICLDADCTVAPNYLQVLEQVQTEEAPASCTIHYEHQFEDMEDPGLKEGIIYYELFLRYYVNALAYAGYPFSMHTIGSSMAVRADIYALSGGMNRRKAGEDFYFLHKIVPLGTFKNIYETSVFPAARTSHRVPFGTGKAQMEWLNDNQKKRVAYHPQTFQDLRQFMLKVPAFYQQDASLIENELLVLPLSIRDFLQTQDFTRLINEMKANSNTFYTFYKRFFTWFDGFKALKFVHYYRDCYYNEVALLEASNWLLTALDTSGSDDPVELLRMYRHLDKERQMINLTDSSSA